MKIKQTSVKSDNFPQQEPKIQNDVQKVNA